MTDPNPRRPSAGGTWVSYREETDLFNDEPGLAESAEGWNFPSWEEEDDDIIE